MTAILLTPAALLLAVLLYAEKREHTLGKLLAKPAVSALFILVAWLQPWPTPSLAAWLLAGLALSWLGDLFLVFQSDRLFLAGLVAFLLGHVCYAAGLGAHGVLNGWVMGGAVLLGGVGWVVFVWLRPHLGEMTAPVAAYIVVISTMVASALAVLFNADLGWSGRLLALAGAVLFYLSDISVARDRFVVTTFANRLWGLPCYYAAQFLIAFATGRL